LDNFSSKSSRLLEVGNANSSELEQEKMNGYCGQAGACKVIYSLIEKGQRLAFLNIMLPA
jgi:hypothetical protein